VSGTTRNKNTTAIPPRFFSKNLMIGRDDGDIEKNVLITSGTQGIIDYVVIMEKLN
jgi:hypothetical protein